MNLETLTLERTKFGLKQAISEEVHLDVEVDIWQDHMLNSVIYAFHTEIWSHKLPPETKVETTQLRTVHWESAWQLWKNNHQYSWWLKPFMRFLKQPRFVMKSHTATVTFDMDKRVLFPEYNYPAQLGQNSMQVALTSPVWEWH